MASRSRRASATRPLALLVVLAFFGVAAEVEPHVLLRAGEACRVADEVGEAKEPSQRRGGVLACRLLGSAREVTLRTAMRDEIPGSIINVTPKKHWTHARHPYLSGESVHASPNTSSAKCTEQSDFR